MSFPLKFKLIAIITVLLSTAVAFYVTFALNLFKEDKSAEIYEESLYNASSLADRTGFFLKSNHETILLMAKAFQNSSNVQIISDIFQVNSDMLEFSVFRKESGVWKKVFHLFDKNALESYDLDSDYFTELEKRRPFPLSSIENAGIFIENSSVPNGIPHFIIGHYDKNRGDIYTARISFSRLAKIFQDVKKYKSFLINNMGHVFLEKEGKIVFSGMESAVKKYLAEIVGGEIERGAKRFELPQIGPFLSAFTKIKDFNLFVISEIPESTAFKAADYLVNKSLYYGLLVLSLAVIIGVYFSQQITWHLNKLFGATQKIAEGDFESHVEISARDEIGALSDSFNFMSKEIVRYMEEMKEKARLENEVKVAQLVQSSFFPNDKMKIQGLDIAAYYTPASECGGDWWGAFDADGKVILIIADATGHGVPAALLTATANCCANNIELIGKTDPSIYTSAARIMQIMNHAVCSVGSEIMMTCFVGIYNPENGDFIYSNGSHNPPLKYVYSQEDPSKNSFEPLMGANGPRLGHKMDALYEDDCIKLSKGDGVILFTDGIIEAVNVEEKQYGQRRFLKSLALNAKNNSEKIIEATINDAYEFYAGVRPDDDITLVSVKVGEVGVVERNLNQDMDEHKIRARIKHFSHHSEVLSSLQERMIEKEVLIFQDLDVERADIIIIDSNVDFKAIPEIFWEQRGKNVIVLTDFEDERNILNILARYPVHHLVGVNSVNIVDELSNCIDKILGAPLWGIEGLVTGGKIERVENIISNDEISKIINGSLEKFSFEEYFDSPKDYLSMMTNELLTNAIYHSGKDQATMKTRSSHDRTGSFTLPVEEGVSFSIGMNSKNIVVSVTDKTGRLEREKIIESLKRSFQEKKPEVKEGGAGLGLYLIYQYANQIIFNVKEGEKSEVICIIDNNKRFKKYKERITSFHYYKEA